MAYAAHVSPNPARAMVLLLAGAMLCAAVLLLAEIVSGFSAFAAPAPPAGQWIAEDIGGGGVLDRVQTTLVIAEDGAVSGSGGCNRYNGKAQLEGSRLAFGPLAATRMACTPAVMMQEQTFLSALERTAAWRFEPLTRKLVLMDPSGANLVRFAQG